MSETLRSTSMLEVNEFLVLDFVRQRGETTRVDIAQQLGLSASSVSRIIRRLEASGSVTEGPGESTGGGLAALSPSTRSLGSCWVWT